MRFIFNLIGELDLWGEKTGKFLGLLMFHITMSSLTGGLWLFWLAYKFYKNRRGYYENRDRGL